MEENLYQKEQPPLNKETLRASVMVNMSVFMIANFNEKDAKFDAKFMIQLKW
jgi:hypothetical protein